MDRNVQWSCPFLRDLLKKSTHEDSQKRCGQCVLDVGSVCLMYNLTVPHKPLYHDILLYVLYSILL